MANQFKKAQRRKAKLRLGITGPSGSGKSFAALTLAKSIGSKIAAIDTENGSLSLYENMCDFDAVDMAAPYTPQRMIEYIKMAEANGYDVLIIDSITHEWSGPGGCLEMNDTTARTKFKGNTWSAWSITKPMHRALLDTIIASSMHIIVTLRSKTETSQEGRNVVKLGMKAEQQDGFEYEMTVVLDIVHEGHYALASKDRTGIFTDQPAQKVTEDTGKKLISWLNSGVDPLPQAPPVDDTPPAPTKPPAQKPAPPATKPAEKSRFAKAQEAIGKAATVARVTALHEFAETLHAKGELTADEMMELSQLCESTLTDIKLATPEPAEELEPAPI